MKYMNLVRYLFPAMKLGLFDFGFSSSKQKTSQTQSGTSNETSTQSSTSTGSGTRTSDTTGLEVLTQLPEEIQAVLTTLAVNLAQDAGADGSANLSAELARRAEGADVALQDAIQRIVAAREDTGKREIASQVAQLASSTGSSQNSFVQQVGLQANQDLQTALAGVQGQLEIEGRKQATNEFAAALSGRASGTTDLVNIVNALRGATTQRTTTGATTEQTDEQQQVLTDLSRLVNSTTTGSSTGKKSGFSLGFGL